MGEEMKNFQEMGLKNYYCGSMESSSFSSMNDSVGSSSSLSSSELADDASSPSSSDSNSPQLGPLFDLAELMYQLPIKRRGGLSKYYHGKSQTFGSLASVKSIEDLAKKESTYIERMKSCKSYGGNLHHHNKFGPKATITKKSPRTSLSSSLTAKVGTNMVINCKN